MKSQELNQAHEVTQTPDAQADTAATPVENGLNAARTVYWCILAFLIFAYGLSGVTEILPGEVGLIRRLGRWTEANGQVTVHRPGLVFALPQPFDTVVKVPIKQERIVEINLLPADAPEDGEADEETVEESAPASESEISSLNSQISNASEESAALTVPQSPNPQYILTGDRSLLGLSLQTRYRITDPVAWLTASTDVDSVLRSVITASTTAVCREWQSDDVLRRRRRLSDEQSLSLQEEVLRVARQQSADLQLGIELTAVEFTAIQPPSDVRNAFVAIQDARVDQESWREEANGEAAEIRLNAERMALVAIADAKGKLDSVLGKVAAELELFEADLAAFEGGAPDITAKRLQREVWESILKESGRIIAVPAGQRAESLWLSLPDQEKSR